MLEVDNARNFGVLDRYPILSAFGREEADPSSPVPSVSSLPLAYRLGTRRCSLSWPIASTVSSENTQLALRLQDSLHMPRHHARLHIHSTTHHSLPHSSVRYYTRIFILFCELASHPDHVLLTVSGDGDAETEHAETDAGVLLHKKVSEEAENRSNGWY